MKTLALALKAKENYSRWSAIWEDFNEQVLVSLYQWLPESEYEDDFTTNSIPFTIDKEY